MTTSGANYVAAGIVDLVEALTPYDLTHGEPDFVYQNQQPEDITRDRGFTLESPSTEPNNTAVTTASRFLTDYVVTMFHAASQSHELDLRRICDDREQLCVALRNPALHNTDYVGAVPELSSSTSRDAVGNYRTEITLTVNHV